MSKQIKKAQVPPPFLTKLYDMVENPNLQQIISWSRNNTSIILLNQNELINKVLHKYFKHKRYTSFLRQLNMYNFRKTKNEEGQDEFSHKFFRKGGRDLLLYIKRRNQKDSVALDINASQALHNQNELKKIQSPIHDLFSHTLMQIRSTQMNLEENTDLLIASNASVYQNLKAIRESVQQMDYSFSASLARVDNLIQNMDGVQMQCIFQKFQPNIENFAYYFNAQFLQNKMGLEEIRREATLLQTPFEDEMIEPQNHQEMSECASVDNRYPWLKCDRSVEMGRSDTYHEIYL